MRERPTAVEETTKVREWQAEVHRAAEHSANHHKEPQGTLRGKFIPWLGTSVQSLRRVRLFATPWTAAHQASLSFTISQSLFKFRSIKSVMPSNHLILCCPLLLLPLILPSIRVFSSESVLCIRCPKYWSLSFSISPSNEHSGLRTY